MDIWTKGERRGPEDAREERDRDTRTRRKGHSNQRSEGHWDQRREGQEEWNKRTQEARKRYRVIRREKDMAWGKKVTRR